MDTKTFPKTSLFDQISFLMVGAIATIVIVFNMVYFFTMPIPTVDLGSALVWLVISYFLGHVIHGISNAIRDIPIIPLLDWESKLAYLPHEALLLKEAESYFEQPYQEKKPDHLWSLCYIFATAKDTTSQVETFSAYYNLYRGWFTTLLIETLFLSYFLVFSYTHAMLAVWILSIAIAVLMYRRAKRFWQYLHDKVFGIFLITLKFPKKETV
ncbi:MAG: hypothetical protein ACD_81C00168G0004 [uncultured bacterium]|uniref:Glycosyl-4,4'-diaponeurosporenoate acyltransferase n=1 Tax=Candidatus Wolfebacteria bacterium GW2011_GWE2_44_13 TaxID=1619017 RepID=A0A0G1H888_9BACT|nr:MAG: hypothetical protein ACD_81C00168G0004 [uncultured bacterium]KKT43586.1 MAG: hypothetical protein UW32_C0001G0178 [Candidatus Wolfebacteria bacterium GW2011_GWE2_44_13]